MPLSDTAARQAKPREKDYTLPDLDGLSLFVARNGTKSWHFRYTWKGRRVRISLGTYPEISLKEARARRDVARSKVATGIDPRTPDDQAPDALLFRDVAEQWYAFKAPRLTKGRQGSAAQTRRYLDGDILPAVGSRPIAEIRRPELIRLVQAIEARGALHVAEKVRTWLRQIFRYALVHEYVDASPAADLDVIAAVQPPVKHNPILRKPELGEFVRRLRAFSGSPITKAGIQLLLLTGVRTHELRHASPGQFDLDAGLWRVPASSVKQLQKLVRMEGGAVPDYIVPLSRQALEIVRELKSQYGAYPYLLPGRNDSARVISENTLNMGIKKMGYEGRLTGHGLRGTLSTALYEAGYASAWIEAQLSHADPNGVRGSYNHAEHVEQRRGMMQEWADMLDELASQP